MARETYRSRLTTPYINTDSPERMAANDRTRAWNYGDAFEQDFGDDAEQYGRRGENYSGQADQYYQDLMGNPGYTQEERERILDENRLNRAVTSPEQQAGNYLTDDEQQGIRGDPWARGQGFDPGRLEQTDAMGQGWRRDALYGGRDSVRDAVNTNDRFTMEALDRNDENVLGAMNRGEGMVRGAMDQGDQRVDSALGNWEGKNDSAINRTEGKLDDNLNSFRSRNGEIIDPNKLGISDETVNGIKSAAGRVAGMGYQSQMDELERNAAARGNVNPLALADMKKKYERSIAIDSGNAEAEAYLRAKEAQRGANMDIAGLQLGANRDEAGMGERAASGIGDMRLRSSDQIGSTRTGINNDRSQFRAGMENDLTNRSTNANLNLGSRRGDMLNSQGNRRVGVEQGIMNADIGVQDTNANSSNQTAQYNTNTGLNVSRDRDDTQANRAFQIGQNRQNVNFQNQDQQFNQNFQTSQAGSNRGVTIGNARRGDQTEGRGYYTGQGQFNTEQSGNAQSRRIQGANTSLGAQGQATGNVTSYRTQVPTWKSRIANAGMQAGAAFLGGA